MGYTTRAETRIITSEADLYAEHLPVGLSNPLISVSQTAPPHFGYVLGEC